MNMTAVRLTVQTVGHLEKQGSAVRGTTYVLFFLIISINSKMNINITADYKKLFGEYFFIDS